MLAECRDIVTQFSAATKALEKAGFKLVASGLTYCVEHPQDRRRLRDRSGPARVHEIDVRRQT